jgi:hypothetical protein
MAAVISCAASDLSGAAYDTTDLYTLLSNSNLVTAAQWPTVGKRLVQIMVALAQQKGGKVGT